MKVEVDVLGSRSLKFLMVYVDVNQHGTKALLKAQELFESRGDRPGLSIHTIRTMEVEVDVLGSLSLIVRTVSVDLKQH